MPTQELTLAQKKDYGKTLFVVEKLNQKTCAERVGISAKTFGKWVEDGGWKKLQQNIVLTREEQMRKMMEELEELNTFIKSKPEGERFANSKEGDVRRKLIKDIKELETNANVAELIEAGRLFLRFMQDVDFQKGKEIAGYYDAFVKQNLR